MPENKETQKIHAALVEKLQEMEGLKERIERLEETRVFAEKFLKVAQRHPTLSYANLVEHANDFELSAPIDQQVSELGAYMDEVWADAQELLRQLDFEVVTDRLVVESKSGGIKRNIDLAGLKGMGYGDLRIGNRALVKVSETIDKDVFEEACRTGMVDKQALLEAGYLEESPRTRRTFKKWRT